MENRLSELFLTLTQKQEPDDTDDNTVLFKTTAPNDSVQVDDSQMQAFTSYASAMQYGGYDANGVWHEPGWMWGIVGVWG